MNGDRTNSAQAAAVRLSVDLPPPPRALPSSTVHRVELGGKEVGGRVVDLFWKDDYHRHDPGYRVTVRDCAVRVRQPPPPPAQRRSDCEAQTDAGT